MDADFNPQPYNDPGEISSTNPFEVTEREELLRSLFHARGMYSPEEKDLYDIIIGRWKNVGVFDDAERKKILIEDLQVLLDGAKLGKVSNENLPYFRIAIENMHKADSKEAANFLSNQPDLFSPFFIESPGRRPPNSQEFVAVLPLIESVALAAAPHNPIEAIEGLISTIAFFRESTDTGVARAADRFLFMFGAIASEYLTSPYIQEIALELKWKRRVPTDLERNPYIHQLCKIAEMSPNLITENEGLLKPLLCSFEQTIQSAKRTFDSPPIGSDAFLSLIRKVGLPESIDNLRVIYMLGLEIKAIERGVFATLGEAMQAQYPVNWFLQMENPGALTNALYGEKDHIEERIKSGVSSNQQHLYERSLSRLGEGILLADDAGIHDRMVEDCVKILIAAGDVEAAEFYVSLIAANNIRPNIVGQLLALRDTLQTQDPVSRLKILFGEDS